MKNYSLLLKKFCVNEDLKLLISELRKESLLEREEYYANNAVYPKDRNLLDRLEFDLSIAKEKIEEE